MNNIAVITPSVRKDGLDLLRESLLKQTVKDFIWIVCSPFAYSDCDIWLSEPKKREGDFWNFNKVLNKLFIKAIESRCDLTILLADNEYMPSNMIEYFWLKYVQNPKRCIAVVGNHYEQVINGEGINIAYDDVRRNQMKTSFELTDIINFDTCCAAFPTKALEEVGLIDEIWDKYACFGDRELQLRIQNKGYELYLSKEIEFIGRKHDKKYDPNNKWQERYEAGLELFNKRNGV